LLADDTAPDRDAGAWNVSPIVAVATWTSFTVEKPAAGISIKNRPIGKTQTTRKNGSTSTSVEAWEERITIKFKGLLNADRDNFMLMLTCGDPQIRFYRDSVTNPSSYHEYTIRYSPVTNSPEVFKLSKTGVEGFRIIFTRAYTP